MEITDFLKYPVRYDGHKYCNYLLNPDGEAVAQILGWYGIKKLFTSKAGYFGKKREKAAEAFIDKVGNFIAEAINEKLEKIKEQK